MCVLVISGSREQPSDGREEMRRQEVQSVLIELDSEICVVDVGQRWCGKERGVVLGLFDNRKQSNSKSASGNRGCSNFIYFHK